MRRFGLVLVVLLGGCSLYFEEDGGGNDDGWVEPPIDGGPAPVMLPFEVTQAWELVNGAWEHLGPADWSCWQTPIIETAPGAPIPLGGRVLDWLTRAPVSDARVIARSTLRDSIALGEAAGSAMGRFTMVVAPLPEMDTRYSFEVAAPDHVETWVRNIYLEPGSTTNRDLVVVSGATMTALPELVGRSRDVGESIILGDVVDCQGHSVSGVIALANGLPDERLPVERAETFYFASQPGFPTPGLTATANNGRFVVLGVERRISFVWVQIFGFRDEAELAARTPTLLSMVQMNAFEIDAANVAVFTPQRLAVRE